MCKIVGREGTASLVVIPALIQKISQENERGARNSPPSGARVNTRTGKGLRLTRPGKGGGQILPLPAISASIRARITKLGKRKDTPVNFMVCNFGDLGSIF